MALDCVAVPGYVDPREVGKGGSARVYAATSERTGEVVALKVFSAGSVDRRRIHRELCALERLAGIPHVVPMLDVATATDGSPVMVMPFLPTTMSRRVSAGAVTPDVAVGWMSEVATAVDQAALLDVHHRDVKPANVLIDEGDHAHLADFGIAALTEIDTGTVTASAFSPPYAAPERFDGTDVDPLRSDIYSLAATAWAAIVGEAPFGTTTTGGVSGLIGRIMANRLDRPAAMPEALFEVLRVGMAVDPSRRHPTATALATAARRSLMSTDPDPEHPEPERPGDQPWWTTPAPAARGGGPSAPTDRERTPEQPATSGPTDAGVSDAPGSKRWWNDQ